MLTFDIRKPDPWDSTRFVAEGPRVLHLRSRYSISVAARDFVSAHAKTATLSLYSRDDAFLAGVELSVDPLRRDVRTGTLDLSEPDVVRKFLTLRLEAYRKPGSSIPRFVNVRLVVSLDGDTVLSGEVPVEFMPSLDGADPVLTPEDAGLVDPSGEFYLPVFKRSGVQVYRKMTEHVDEHGTTAQISDELFVRTAEGEFVALPEEVPNV